MANVLLIKGASQYNAMRNYIDEIETGFRLAGYHTYVADLLGQSWPYQGEELLFGVRIDVLFTCNAVFTEARRVFEHAWYVTYMTDHPAYHKKRLESLCDRCVVFTCDRRHEAYIRRYLPNIKYVKFVPLAGMAVYKGAPYCERSREIVFTGSYSDPKKKYEDIFKRTDEYGGLTRQMAERVISHPGEDLEACLRSCLESAGKEVSDREFHELACEMKWVDSYARSYYRDRVIRSLLESGLPARVFGNGWEQFEGDGKENLILEKGDYYVAMKAVADAKISLNVMPWFKDGFQERVAAAMLSGTAAVTDESRYIRENFADGEELCVYSLERLEELPKKIKWLLSHPAEAERIAEAGRARAKKEMTWQHKAFEMARYLQECAGLYPEQGGRYGDMIQIPFRTLRNRAMALDTAMELREILGMMSQVRLYDKVEACDIEYFYTKFLFLYTKACANIPELTISGIAGRVLSDVSEDTAADAAELLELECMRMLAVLLEQENQLLQKDKELLCQEKEEKKSEMSEAADETGVGESLRILRSERRAGADRVSDEALLAGGRAVKEMEGASEEERLAAVARLKAEIPQELPFLAAWQYSVLLAMRRDPDVFCEFARFIREKENVFPPNTQYFLFYQLMRVKFCHPEFDTVESTAELWNLYREIMDQFASKMQTPLDPVSRDQRDEGLVLVIADQILGTEHGPTKTALDRCAALIGRCKKKTMLINNAEMLSAVGEIPFYDAKDGIYAPENMQKDALEWNGASIPYLQCDNQMPEIGAVDYLLSQIRRMAPGRLIFIGKGGVLGNLAGRMFPSLAIGLCPSALEYTAARYQALGRPLNERDRELLKAVGLNEGHVIESVFTSGLKPQEQKITRADLGLPQDAFVMAVVGMRLDLEVTDEFLQAAEEALTDGMRLVFFGKFDHYREKIKQFPALEKQSESFGPCEDVLSRLEVCDLYLNPDRRGGGTSCVEALLKGVPVVTTDFGDVAVNAGKAFCVKDYEEMKLQIRRYYEDAAFYQEMSFRAKKRAQALLDTETEFVKILQEMDAREQGREN